MKKTIKSQHALQGVDVRGAIRRHSAIRFLLFFFFLVTGFWFLVSGVEAAVGTGTNRRLETGEANEAGPKVSSPTSGRRASSSLGAPFATGKLSGSRFRIQPGFLAASLSTTKAVPPSQLDLTVLSAKTAPLGLAIPSASWQRDADPIFIWDAPAGGLDLAGYSYALDAQPDDTVDTTDTSWDVAQDPIKRLADGQHTFWVKALNTAGNSGKAASFEPWVDTTPPTITSYGPTPGGLLNTLSPTISATLVEPHSGVDVDGLVLSVNGSRASVSFDEATGIATARGAGLLREGTNRMELRVTDRLGNAQTPVIWSVTADVTPPTGSVALNAGASMTTSVYATLNLAASDTTSGVSRMLISNDPIIGYVEEPFAATRELWRLNAVRGAQKVYVKFADVAGNVSEPVFDEIELGLLAPDTVILSGPAGATPERAAQFTFSCPEGDCVFSYAFDHQEWSPWSTAASVNQAGLPFGNHYFKVKAAREANGIPGIQPDEEDPTPAERTWIVGVQLPTLVPRGSPIKLWRLE